MKTTICLYTLVTSLDKLYFNVILMDSFVLTKKTKMGDFINQIIQKNQGGG